MRIGAYQFAVTGNIESNYAHIKTGIEKAFQSGVRLLLFPECAVTGYPPHCVAASADVDFDQVLHVHHQIQALSEQFQMYIVAGTIIKESGKYYNSAVVFCPNGKREVYSKRALWGWDRENFSQGHQAGVFHADSFTIGIRICFEVRFPEYFRELYRAQTDLNLILFYDQTDQENPDRYRMIQGHIQTRAVENVCYTLTCNTCAPCQTAPTGIFDRSGWMVNELEQGKEGLLLYHLKKTPLNFGELGRKEISDSLLDGYRE